MAPRSRKLRIIEIGTSRVRVFKIIDLYFEKLKTNITDKLEKKWFYFIFEYGIRRPEYILCTLDYSFSFQHISRVITAEHCATNVKRHNTSDWLLNCWLRLHCDCDRGSCYCACAVLSMRNFLCASYEGLHQLSRTKNTGCVHPHSFADYVTKPSRTRTTKPTGFHSWAKYGSYVPKEWEGKLKREET